MEDLPTAVFVCNAFGDIQMFNKAANSVFGYRKGEQAPRAGACKRVQVPTRSSLMRMSMSVHPGTWLDRRTLGHNTHPRAVHAFGCYEVMMVAMFAGNRYLW
jgi:hypothetical protein